MIDEISSEQLLQQMAEIRDSLSIEDTQQPMMSSKWIRNSVKFSDS